LPELDHRTVSRSLGTSSVEELSCHSSSEFADPRLADLVDIVSGYCYGVHGGRQLCHLASSFHLRIRDLSSRSALSAMPGYSFTYRNLQFACQTMQFYSCSQGVAPIRALIWGLLRSYGAGTASDADKFAVFETLRAVFRQHLDIWSQQHAAFVIETEPRGNHRRHAVDNFAAKVFACAASVERVGVSLLTCLLQNRHLDVLGDHSAGVATPLTDATSLFLSSIVLPQQPANAALTSALAGLTQGSLPVKSVLNDANFIVLGALSGAYSSASGFDQARLLKDMQEACFALMEALKSTIETASIVDARARSALLERVELCITPYEGLLRHPGVAPLSHGDRRELYLETQQKVLGLFSEIKFYCSQRHLLSCLSHELLLKHWQELNEALNTEGCRRIGWAIQRELAHPLISVSKARTTLDFLRR
jgi:hypothetical protein